jgi:phosphoribosylaminoimidazole-succinocarboxamide synthase
MVDPTRVAPFYGFRDAELPTATSFSEGKVRDIFYIGDDELVISTSDRISAFDRILGAVPVKGEVLNRLSVYWFGKTGDIIRNHLLATISPRAVLATACHVIPVEVVVRGYLTGSAWRDYSAGRAISGIELPAGMRENQRFDTPLLTPSTKESDGLHDRPCSRDEILAADIVPRTLWEQIEETALQLFARGSKLAAEQGLILVDTKYEFGIRDDELYLIDEIHTPDSSRYWFADSYQERFQEGEYPRQLDKEYLRRWLMEQGFSGDGNPPDIPQSVLHEVSRRYQEAFELITGTEFKSLSLDSEAEKQKILSFVEERQDDQDDD